MREKKKKTTERTGSALSSKDSNRLRRRLRRNAPARVDVFKTTTRKQKEIFGERRSDDDENTSFGPPSPALDAITFTTA